MRVNQGSTGRQYSETGSFSSVKEFGKPHGRIACPAVSAPRKRKPRGAFVCANGFWCTSYLRVSGYDRHVFPAPV